MGEGQPKRRDFIQKAAGAVGAALVTSAIQLSPQRLAAMSSPAGTSEAALNASAWFVGTMRCGWTSCSSHSTTSAWILKMRFKEA